MPYVKDGALLYSGFQSPQWLLRFYHLLSHLSSEVRLGLCSFILLIQWILLGDFRVGSRLCVPEVNPNWPGRIFHCLAGLRVLTSHVPDCPKGKAGCSLNGQTLSDRIWLLSCALIRSAICRAGPPVWWWWPSDTLALLSYMLGLQVAYNASLTVYWQTTVSCSHLAAK